MQPIRVFLIIWLYIAAGVGLAQDSVLRQAGALEEQGRFKEAAAALSAAQKQPDLTSKQRAQLRFELDRLERIKKDFTLSQDELFAALKKAVKDLTRREFDEWVKEGRFDSRVFDGRRCYMVSSVANLFFRYPELDSRRVPPRDSSRHDKAVLELAREIRSTAVKEQTAYVLPKRFEAEMTVTAKPGAAPAGEIVRAWLPIPRTYRFHNGFELLASSPECKAIDPERSPIRSVYMEKVAARGAPTEFKIRYAYQTRGVWFDLQPGKIRPLSDHPETRPFLREAPHVQFTPEMRALSARIAGTETNACRKAKRFYDWIAENIKYSFAIEYSTIRDIGEYCRARGYGDCGQEALLFITLCRLNGIPARWQSGWTIFPGAKSIHDWTEIYLEPYGWVPVDPYMGIYAINYAKSLKAPEKEELRDFYFGGLDPYRMIANSDHSQELSRPKQSMRSDDVDFQRGELEWGDNNIYFDSFTYDLTVREVEPRME